MFFREEDYLSFYER